MDANHAGSTCNSAIGTRSRALDHVAKFATLPGQSYCATIASHGQECGPWLDHASRRRIAGSAREFRNVIATLTQWRDGNRKDIQAVEQVVAERLADVDRKVAIRRGNDADIDRDWITSDALDGARFECPEQEWLKREWEFTYFVEKERSPMCRLESAGASPHRTGESARLVTKQFACGKTRYKSTAVCCNERPGSSPAPCMNEQSNEFLAGSCFTVNEDRRIGVGNLFDRAPHCGDCRA